jgi:hypothetical protein
MKPMKYALKDLIYLTAIAAVLLAWGRDAWKNADRIDELNRIEIKQREEIAQLKLQLQAESNSRIYASRNLELTSDQRAVFHQLQTWAYRRLLVNPEDHSVLDK